MPFFCSSQKQTQKRNVVFNFISVDIMIVSSEARNARMHFVHFNYSGVLNQESDFLGRGVSQSQYSSGMSLSQSQYL